MKGLYKTIRKSAALMTLVLLALASPRCFASPGVVDYSFMLPGAEEKGWGNAKKGPVHLAVKMSLPQFVGKEVTAIKVPVQVHSSLQNYKLWIASELVNPEEGFDFSGDLFSVDATPDADGFLSATLPEPLTIGESGLYLGYSMEITEVTAQCRYPVYGTLGTNKDGFYLLGAERYTKWQSLAHNDIILPFTATLAGEFDPVCIEPRSESLTHAVQNADNRMTFTVANFGTDPISSIQVTLQDNTPFDCLCTFEPAVTRGYGEVFDITVDVPPINIDGPNTFKYNVTKVNGADNAAAATERRVDMVFHGFLPRHRPLFEEGTGVWCINCPRGFVAIETLKEMYPEDFVCVSYHYNDVMTMAANVPDMFTSWPKATIERGYLLDPYHGETSSVPMGILDQYVPALNSFAMADIGLQAEWTGDYEISATATVRWAEVPEGEWDVRWVLCADGLTGDGSEWSQVNGLSGTMPDGYNDAWTQKPHQVEDMVYDDVAILAPAEPTPLPAPVRNAEASVTATFDVSQALNTDGMPLVQNRDRLSLVAFIAQKSDVSFPLLVINAAKTPCGIAPTVESSLQSLQADRQPVRTEYYTLQGVRVADPRGLGIVLRVATMPDGSLRTEKTTFPAK